MRKLWAITTQLDRKLIRDLYRIRSQAAAIGLVLAAGIAMMVMSLASRDALLRSQASFYRDSRFGHLFASLKRAPNWLIEAVADIEGVQAVDQRLLYDVTLDVPGLTEPAVGRLISLPDRGHQSLNVVRLRSGREPELGRAGEVIASEAFAQAHRLRPGDRLRAVLNGRYQWLTVVGIGLSPEYLIQIPPGSLLPDDLRFGVLWMPESQLAAAFNMEGAFNSLSLQLQPRVNQQRVIDHLDRLLEPYGGLGAYQRHDQISHRYVSDELDQLGVMATIAPAIFLGVAAFLIQVILTRQIGLQREQIATLKAFGFSSREVTWHYLKQMLLLATLAGWVGWLVGLYLAGGMTQLYANFYRFPEFQLHWDPRLLLIGWLVSGVAAGAGAVRPLRQAFRMMPAEAMRPPAPANFQTLFWERWGWTEAVRGLFVSEGQAYEQRYLPGRGGKDNRARLRVGDHFSRHRNVRVTDDRAVG
jgi:putative ABC transport system permease protein